MYGAREGCVRGIASPLVILRYKYFFSGVLVTLDSMYSKEERCRNGNLRD